MLIFACIWLAFGLVYSYEMIHLYRQRSRGGGDHDDDDDDDDSQEDATDVINLSTIKYQTIQHWEKGQLLRLPLFTIRTSCLHWDVMISINAYTLSMILFGFIGGFLTSITGSGADLLVFATSYFIFHIDRSTAIATSVAVMSITSIAAYYYYQFEKNFILQEVYSIWLIAIPCVSIGLPMSTIATIKFLPAFSNQIGVNVFNIVQFIIIILLMTSTLQHSNILLISSTIIFIIAMMFFVSIMFIGRRDDVYLNNHISHVLVATYIAGETIAQILIKPDNMDISGRDGEENKDSEGDDTQITESDDTIGRDRKIADVCYDDDGNWVMTLPSTSTANSPMVEYGRIYGSMLPSPLMTPYKGSPNVEYADVYQSHCYYHHDSDSPHRGGEGKGKGEADDTNSPKFEYDRSDSIAMIV